MPDELLQAITNTIANFNINITLTDGVGTNVSIKNMAAIKWCALFVDGASYAFKPVINRDNTVDGYEIDGTGANTASLNGGIYVSTNENNGEIQIMCKANWVAGTSDSQKAKTVSLVVRIAPTLNSFNHS